MSVYRALAAMVACLVAVGGCSAHPPEPRHRRTATGASSGPPAAPTRLSPWWVSTGDYLSGGTLQGNRVLTLARGAGAGTIDVVALDRDSGAEMWRLPWSPSGSADTFGVGVAVVETPDDRVAVFPLDGGESPKEGIPFQTLVAVRVSDGRVTSLLDGAYVPWPARPCGPGGRRLCAGVQLPGQGWRWLEVDPTSGDRRLTSMERPLAVFAQDLAVTRMDDGGADPNERLVMVRDGRVQWSVNSLQTFGSRLAGGSTILNRGDGDLVVVSTAGSGDWATARTVALRPTDGTVVWHRQGVAKCGAAAEPSSTRFLMACEGAGRPDTPGSRLALVVLDRATGRTERSYPIDSTTYNASQHPEVEPVVPGHLSSVVVGGRRVLLDGSTGAQVPFDPGAQLCWSEVDAEHRFYPGVHLVAGRSVHACTGPDTDRTITVDEAEAWGVTEGVTTMLRGGKVHAYRR